MRRAPVAALAALVLRAAGAHAQHDTHDGPTWSVRAAVTAIGTRVRPAIAGRTLTEGYLASPIVMGHARLLGGRVDLLGTLDLEGLTLERGQLNPGIYGEGYVDRRHPHTYVHEAMVVASHAVAGARFSVAGGKGFVPFGSDDPMTRPFAQFPVNHHLAQILERAVVIAGARMGALALEVATFNGDEPTHPGDWPNGSRVGDSWSTRVTVGPVRGVEVQGGHARVESPEDEKGRGLDQQKWSTSARWTTMFGATHGYAMVEWARSDLYSRGRRAFRFSSTLAEGELRHRALSAALRLERTVRPEDERLNDPFRSPFPVAEVHILGATRWDVATGALRARVPWRRMPVRAEPFVEVAHLRPREVFRPTVFVPREFYGASRIWSVSAGVRIDAGTGPHRMGRYGVVAERGHASGAGHP